MKKIDKPSLKTDKDLMSYDAVRYCETFYQYCRHIELYFDEKLTEDEKCALNSMQYRLKQFVFDYAKAGSPYREFVGCYMRLLNRMNSLL